jgi:hypothetical protein
MISEITIILRARTQESRTFLPSFSRSQPEGSRLRSVPRIWNIPAGINSPYGERLWNLAILRGFWEKKVDFCRGFCKVRHICAVYKDGGREQIEWLREVLFWRRAMTSFEKRRTLKRIERLSKRLEEWLKRPMNETVREIGADAIRHHISQIAQALKSAERRW